MIRRISAVLVPYTTVRAAKLIKITGEEYAKPA